MSIPNSMACVSFSSEHVLAACLFLRSILQCYILQIGIRKERLIPLFSFLSCFYSFISFRHDNVLVVAAKQARLKQAKEEAEKEIAALRAHLETEFQKKLSKVNRKQKRVFKIHLYEKFAFLGQTYL